MAFSCIKFRSFLKLTCELGDEVLIKINNPEILLCNENVTDPENYLTYIKAVITRIETDCSCSTPIYTYTFRYEDDILIDPESVINAVNVVKVCCSNCVVDFIEEKIVPSSQAGNQLVIGDDCKLYVPIGSGDIDCEDVPACETPITLQDSTSVDLTGSGVSNHTISAQVIIDPDPENELEIRENGLFVPPSIDCDEVPACETPIIVNDTTTIDLTASGTSNHTLSADVIIDPNPDNELIITGSGLYVAPSINCSEVPICETPITANDTFTIDLTAGGTSNHTISGDVRVHPDPDNQIQVTSDGLLVDPAPVQSVAAECFTQNYGTAEDPEIGLVPSNSADALIVGDGAGCWTQLEGDCDEIPMWNGNGLSATPFPLKIQGLLVMPSQIIPAGAWTSDGQSFLPDLFPPTSSDATHDHWVIDVPAGNILSPPSIGFNPCLQWNTLFQSFFEWYTEAGVSDLIIHPMDLKVRSQIFVDGVNIIGGVIPDMDLDSDVAFPATSLLDIIHARVGGFKTTFWNEAGVSAIVLRFTISIRLAYPGETRPLVRWNPVNHIMYHYFLGV